LHAHLDNSDAEEPAAPAPEPPVSSSDDDPPPSYSADSVPAPAADPTLPIFVFTLEEEEQTTLLSTHDHPISGLQLLVAAVDQVTEDTHPTPSPAVTSNDNTSSSPEDDSLLLRPAEVNYLVNLFR